MSDESKPEEVGLPPSVKRTLSSMLAHAAAQDRTVIELRTGETAAGRRHFTHALEITDHVAEMENELNEPRPEKGDMR